MNQALSEAIEATTDALVAMRRGEGVRFAQEPAAIGVLEIEDGVEGPVQVIREPGRLPE